MEFTGSQGAKKVTVKEDNELQKNLNFFCWFQWEVSE